MAQGELITEPIPVIANGPAKGLQLAPMYYVRADGRDAANNDVLVLASGQDVCGPCLPAYLAELETRAHTSGYIHYSHGYRLAIEAYTTQSETQVRCAQCGNNVRLDGQDRMPGTFFAALGQAPILFHEDRRVFVILPTEMSDLDIPTVFTVEHSGLSNGLTFFWNGMSGYKNSFTALCEYLPSLKLADRTWFPVMRLDDSTGNR